MTKSWTFAINYNVRYSPKYQWTKNCVVNGNPNSLTFLLSEIEISCFVNWTKILRRNWNNKKYRLSNFPVLISFYFWMEHSLKLQSKHFHGKGFVKNISLPETKYHFIFWEHSRNRIPFHFWEHSRNRIPFYFLGTFQKLNTTLFFGNIPEI